jgi:hypothetical protein
LARSVRRAVEEQRCGGQGSRPMVGAICTAGGRRAALRRSRLPWAGSGRRARLHGRDDVGDDDAGRDVGAGGVVVEARVCRDGGSRP